MLSFFDNYKQLPLDFSSSESAVSTGQLIDCLGIGLATLDRFLLLEHYPQPDQKIEAVGARVCGGGPVANAVYLLGKLGAKTAYYGILGKDAAGQQIIEELQAADVDTSSVVIDPSFNTPEAQIWVDKSSGARNVSLSCGQAIPSLLSCLPVEMIKRSRHILLDGRDIEAGLETARLTKFSESKIVCDFGSVRPQIDLLIGSVDILIVSSDFARDFTGEDNNKEYTLKKLSKYGAEISVITYGGEGCIWKDITGIRRHPAYDVKVLDTTGAGDAFHGGFIYGLIQGWDHKKCIEFASRCAAMTCTILGGRDAIQSEEDVWNVL